MKNFRMGFTAAILILPIGALGYFRSGYADAQSDVAPPGWEKRLMSAAVQASVKRNATAHSTPEAANEQQLVEGGKLYMNGCAGCHGELGKTFGEDHSNYPRVPQLPYAGTR